MPLAGSEPSPADPQTLLLALNPALDLPDLAEQYAAGRRIQIRDFLNPASAKAVLSELQRLPWGLRYNDGSDIVTTRAEALARLSRDEAASVMSGIHERARTGYQFLYGVYPLSTAYFSPTMERLPIHHLYEFINSKAMLGMVRKVSGQPNLIWADGKATCYRPGHFLKAHTDAGPGRVVAYVMNFTSLWDPDWGGLLQFLDGEGDVEQALCPRFNALNLFTVPMGHSVSMVAPYVAASRYSVTGWFRNDQPPGPIGR